jgi:hypothetical protein
MIRRPRKRLAARPAPPRTVEAKPYETARVCATQGCQAHVIHPVERCPWCHQVTEPLTGPAKSGEVREP